MAKGARQHTLSNRAGRVITCTCDWGRKHRRSWFCLSSAAGALSALGTETRWVPHHAASEASCCGQERCGRVCGWHTYGQLHVRILAVRTPAQPQQPTATADARTRCSAAPRSTSKGLASGSKPGSPKVAAASSPSPERQPSNLGPVPAAPQGGYPAGGPPGSAEEAEEVGEGEPSEEDVARAFAMYDTEGVGEIPTLSLDGELGCMG